MSAHTPCQQTCLSARASDPLRSRRRQPPAPTSPAADRFSGCRPAQQTRPKVVAMSNSPSLQIVLRPAGDTTILGDISTGTFRRLCRQPFDKRSYATCTKVHHPGVRATTRLVKASFCWPKMGRDIAAAARACMGCQLGKIHRHVKLQPEHIPVPRRCFAHLHVDLVGATSQFQRLYTLVYYCRQNNEVAGSCPCLCQVRRRLCSRPFLRLGATVRTACGNHQ
jgi:hypothetical protein